MEPYSPWLTASLDKKNLIEREQRTSQMDPLQLQKMKAQAEANATGKPVFVPESGNTMSFSERLLQQQMNDPEMKELQAQERALTQQRIEEQAAGVKSIEDDIAKESERPRDINFAPLASYIDSIVEGSNISKGYVPPETETERATRLMGLKDKLQGRKGDLTSAQISALKEQLANRNQANYLKSIRADNFQTAQGTRLLNRAQDDINKNVLNPIEEDETKLSTLDENLASGDYGKIAASLSNFSRVVAGEKGVLTDQDIIRVIPKNFQGNAARFFAYFNETPTDKVDPAYAKTLIELTNTARRKTAEKHENLLKNRASQYSARGDYSTHMSKDGAVRLMLNDAGARVKAIRGVGQPQTSTNTQVPTGLPTFDPERYK